MDEFDEKFKEICRNHDERVANLNVINIVSFINDSKWMIDTIEQLKEELDRIKQNGNNS